MSYKKNPFSNAPKKHVNKTRFNHSHEHKSQMMPGYLYPASRPIEMLPNDSINIQTEFMFRFAPLYFPIMHRMTMRADYYYIPYRILWPQLDPSDSSWVRWLTKNEEQAVPVMTAMMSFNTLAININVLAYMGVPLLHTAAGYETHIPELNAMPLSAYLMIWDWYERVPQLEEAIWFPLVGGPNTTSFETAFGVGAGFVFPLLSAKWEKDMFTSATPTPQQGDAIQIPVVQDFGDLTQAQLDGQLWREIADGTAPSNNATLTTTNGGQTKDGIAGTTIYHDIQSTAGTIRQLREAEVLQSFYERIMKIGDRYNDFIEGLWGNEPQPGLIDIPVLIGSQFGRVQISDVMTSASNDLTGSTDGSRTGDYTGQANLYERGGTINYKCNEHGLVLCLVQLNANTSYGQGIERLWRRNVQTDYALDMFASIGDQEILKEEVMYNALTADLAKNEETFGYIDRFAEYKWTNNLHVANMNFNAGLSQHMGRYWDPTTTTGATYDSAIEINASFTNSAPFGQSAGHRLTDVFRVLPSGIDSTQYPTESVIFAWLFHSIFIERALPLYSTPKL